tara:strand:+ start:2144 stop:3643 length:1500 start_codon:yes stop_codon:yes gene_type:complete
MKRGILRKIKLNVVAGYFNFILTSIFVFFINPFLVKFLGSSTFGVWKNIQKLLSFASIADGRSTQALKWIIANDEYKNDFKIKKQAVGSAIKIWVYFLPLVLLFLFLLIYNLPFLINGLDKQNFHIIYQVGFILGANILISPLLKIPDAILVGTNRGYKSTFIQIFGMILSNLLMVIVSYLGYGLIGLSFVVLFITLFNAFFVYLICKSNIKWLGIEKPSSDQISDFFKFSFWVLIWSFVMKLILSTEILLIGFLISSETVTDYVFSTYIIQLAISISLLTGSAITPSLGSFMGAKMNQKVKKIISSMREIITFIALFFGSLVILINEDFVVLWMGEEFYLGSKSNLLIVSIMIILVLTRIESQIQDLSLKIKNKVLYGLFASILSLISAVIGFYFFHNKIEGLLLGVLIGRIVMYLIFSNMVNKMIKIRHNYKRGIYIIILISIVFFLEMYIPLVNNWFNLFLYLVLITSIYIPLLYFLIFSRNTRKDVLNILKKIKI